MAVLKTQRAAGARGAGFRWAVGVGLAGLASGCAAHRLELPPRVAESLPGARTAHVLLVSIDGLRPDAIGPDITPTLGRLAREGGHTFRARTILPSKTLPSHTSMLTGLPPEGHGVLWNTPATAQASAVSVPTVFAMARARGYVTAAFFSKPKFQPLQVDGALDYTQAPGGWWGGWDADRTVRDVEAYLQRARPNLLFVHLAEPDRAGHRDGWMSPSYTKAVAVSDAAVSRLVQAATRTFGDGQFTVIVTADHGGHDRDHGSSDPRDVTIPWMAWGRAVRSAPIDGSSVHTVDTAATVLWLLGIDRPTAWAGRPVTEAFLDTAELAAAH